MLLTLLLAVAGQAGPDAGPGDPLAPARDGAVQCFAPDVAKRTCKSIAGYAFSPDGRVENHAEVLVSPGGPLVMTTTSPVQVREGAVCGPVRAEDIDRGEIAMAGRPLGGEQARRIKEQVKGQLGQLLNMEVCTRFEPNAQGWTTRVSVNGQPAPEMSDGALIWVRPGEGWTVAP
jgi:hypothetical protein